MSKTKIILLQNVAKVGTKYDIKEVASGYARNFLIASKKAVLATKEALKLLDKWKENASREMVIKYEEFQKQLSKFDDLVLVIKSKANEDGHLYGAVHAEDIADLLAKDYSLNIDSHWLKLSSAIKSLGDYEIIIKPSTPGGVEEGQAVLKLKVEQV